jgi:hypothetical protein
MESFFFSGERTERPLHEKDNCRISINANLSRHSRSNQVNR